MPIQRIQAQEVLKQDQQRIALQRGPLVYCIEGADNDGKAWNIVFPDNASIVEKPMQVLTEKVIGLSGSLPSLQINAAGDNVQTVYKEVIAIPYYTWCNRGSNQMQVWFPTTIKDVKLNY
jgi:DUF1680 family protein